VGALLAEPAHPAWSDTPLLRRHRLLVLDDDMRWEGDSGALAYDFDLGVLT